MPREAFVLRVSQLAQAGLFIYLAVAIGNVWVGLAGALIGVLAFTDRDFPTAFKWRNTLLLMSALAVGCLVIFYRRHVPGKPMVGGVGLWIGSLGCNFAAVAALVIGRLRGSWAFCRDSSPPPAN